ncbi:MAG: NAD(P)-dependent glycerol-3-phosphate dehydrogenase [Sphingomonadales bacterium]|jgi:glycerol-3-phosphate dehydrogenase (NAD(P)+)|nr:NAD(P)-dependent glycerol-3-phosphate dehydrogenase [Sphingomonadales bacterium]MBK9004695.1 NAD(P)-dependent glycerol-3-phosphate dehydrogenase [Sphingomonadales bacterium]MBK9269878.1 NAD(P)-dependent glycerol-3-phosphate dehydrogenase [Sphingomonadales bacterium]MBP6433806.1 NAD(P)-dependent glycerol-3-phosphate dehydrogenase [Sphingorhabdus sp.]
MTGQPIGVIGAGAWGTALASVMSQNHDNVLLWALEPEVVEAVNAGKGNPLYLPGLALPPQIRATAEMAEMADCSALLMVTPAQHLRGTLERLPETGAPLLLCSKGIEAGTQLLVSEIVAELRPDNPLAVLSGPTFAHEVAAGKPTAITLACESEAMGKLLMRLVATPAFRPYWSGDVVGAEIGGAVKNVLAIGCGVVDGAGLGLNARAALIARGFAEMQRYGLARGAQAQTLAGLSGLGDLVLTCSSENSRNFSLGRGLGQGKAAAELMADRRTVAEGAFTAPVLLESAQALGVEMPIVAAVCALLDSSASVGQVVEALLSRPLKSEG